MRGRRKTQPAAEKPEIDEAKLPERKPKGKAGKSAAPPGEPETDEGSKSGAKGEQQEDGGEQDKIRINRAPVLTLWVAVVAQREGYKFEEGLSFGKAIAGMLARSKGKRLGIIEEEGKKKKKKRRRAEVEMFKVFGMSVFGKTTKDGLRLAVQNGKPISSSSVEAYLRRAFGPNYEEVKAVMEDVANSYSPDEIGDIAYSLYERFRPTIPEGVRGWGAKGVLDLDLLRSLAKK